MPRRFQTLQIGPPLGLDFHELAHIGKEQRLEFVGLNMRDETVCSALGLAYDGLRK
jgi:hypothetical protein